MSKIHSASEQGSPDEEQSSSAKQKKSPHPFAPLKQSFPHYGEIYLVYFNPRKGREVGKLHPAVVISNNIQNEHDHHIIVAPLSDEDWESLAEVQIFEVLIKANSTNGLKKDSKILLNRVRAIDKKLRLRDYVGVADEKAMEQVNKGLEVVLNMKKGL